MLFERKKMLADDPNYSLYAMYEDDMKQFDTSLLSKENEKELVYRYYNNHDKKAYEELMHEIYPRRKIESYILWTNELRLMQVL